MLSTILKSISRSNQIWALDYKRVKNISSLAMKCMSDGAQGIRRASRTRNGRIPIGAISLNRLNLKDKLMR